MKDYLGVGVIIIVAVFIAVLGANHFGPKQFGYGGQAVFYTTPTMATSTVGNALASLILASSSSSRQYADICNTASSTANALMLQFDASSTAVGVNAPGILVPGQSCYEMNPDKMFIGNLYGIFVGSTGTVSTVVK